MKMNVLKIKLWNEDTKTYELVEDEDTRLLMVVPSASRLYVFEGHNGFDTVYLSKKEVEK